MLVSNPCNPTGKTIKGAALRDWVKIGREFDCYMLMDEFYSSYVYSGMRLDETLSAAKYVKDVNEDPVVILDGATKTGVILAGVFLGSSDLSMLLRS